MAPPTREARLPARADTFGCRSRPPSKWTAAATKRRDRPEVLQWVAEDGDNPICPITQLPFVPGQWVATPAEPPANPIN